MHWTSPPCRPALSGKVTYIRGDRRRPSRRRSRAMKLGSLKEGGRDGTLVVVSRDLSRAVKATSVAPTLQRALDDWAVAEPKLRALAEALEAGKAEGAFAF